MNMILTISIEWLTIEYNREVIRSQTPQLSIYIPEPSDKALTLWAPRQQSCDARLEITSDTVPQFQIVHQ